MNSKIVVLCAVFLLIFPFILAVCGEGQININSASTIELDKLTGIGPAKAENIINTRPFESIDDLIDVSGIGPVTLEKIKTQGLACVTEEVVTAPLGGVPSEDGKEIVEEAEEKSDLEQEQEIILEIEAKKEPTNVKKDVIELVPQNIKSEDYTSNLSSSDLAKCGLVLFCVLLGGLFTIRKFNARKNEFR